MQCYVYVCNSCLFSTICKVWEFKTNEELIKWFEKRGATNIGDVKIVELPDTRGDARKCRVLLEMYAEVFLFYC